MRDATSPIGRNQQQEIHYGFSKLDVVPRVSGDVPIVGNLGRPRLELPGHGIARRLLPRQSNLCEDQGHPLCVTWLCVREPVTVVVVGCFVLTTIQGVSVAATIKGPTTPPGSEVIFPAAGFAIALAMVTISLPVLLPYFISRFSHHST